MEGVVLVHGTPCSGKTMLGMLMAEHAAEVKGMKITTIAVWDC